MSDTTVYFEHVLIFNCTCFEGILVRLWRMGWEMWIGYLTKERKGPSTFVTN